MRSDRPHRQGMDYWKGPHAGIIAASPGLDEYRQVHLAEDNPGRWPSALGVETSIPADRRVDGIAEVTQASMLAPLAGRKQTALAYADEVNVFRRTLFYGGFPGWSRWYDLGAHQQVGSRAVIVLRRRDGVGSRAFRNFVKNDLVVQLAATGVLTKLRTQTFFPWLKKLWDTPNVAHDNPRDQRFHASVILGFADDATRDAFFDRGMAARLTPTIAARASAIHAYDVSETLTFVTDGAAVDPGEG